MKARIRVLSLLLALLMLLTLVPELKLPTAAQAEPPAQPQGDETDLTIYFDRQTETFEETLRLKAEETMHLEHVNTDVAGQDYYKSSYNRFKWNHVDEWSVKNDGGRDDLGVLLSSTDDNDKYIVLDANDTHSYDNINLWETIVVSKDKVLDLNGHTFDMRYDANLNQKEDGQTTHPEYHNCVAIEITNGATLTIIDSSAWRSANGKGWGRLSFTAYMVNPHTADINFYTTRDLFKVTWGNLVIYGGEYQAGRKKDQLKKNFTWKKLRTTIGSAVGLGVSIAEYATGAGIATAAFKDEVAKQTNKTAYNENTEASNKDDHSEGTQTTINRDGSNLSPKETTMKDSAGGEGSRNQTVGELKKEKNDAISGGQAGTAEGQNAANDKGTGKDDSNTALAKKQKEVVDKIVNKDSVEGIVGGVFDLIDNIAGMCGADEKTRVTQSIKGTVVQVGDNGCFVAYGGTFKGYGSTPNTRNAVVEVSHLSRSKPWDQSKSNGGVAYIYGGTFEGYNGANIFNMVNSDPGPQYAVEQVANGYGPAMGSVTRTKLLDKSETGGVEVLYYENQDELKNPDLDLETFVPKPINTANVQVRGGTFRCFYDIMNVALKEEGDDQHFTKFPGTMGSVNLGIESYGANLIQDGRIQIVDRYGDGALVLLDERTDEKEAYEAAHPGQTFPEALYHYRLFCGDTELRAKTYLSVSPNTAVTNASASMQLCTYDGNNKKTTQLWVNNTDNIRAPARQTEPYFDYIYDEDSSDSWSVMPNFYNSTQSKLDVYGKFLDSNEVWYYPVPRNASGAEIPATPYGEAYFNCAGKYSPNNVAYKVCSQQVNTEDYWPYALREIAAPGTVEYYLESHDDIRSNIRYFTYRVYRVDPITRENLSENPYYGTDEPLIQATIGCNNGDALKIKLPLKVIERQIQAKRGDFSYQSGEMYRVVFTCDEFLGWGYKGNGVFGGKTNTAHSEATILFRCINHNETVNNGGLYADTDFTPLQWIGAPEAGRKATVNLVKAKAGMTDFRADCKIFDVYYQWWEVDANGNPIRLLAGTDNVYDVSGDDPEYDGNWENHKPNMWNVGTDGKTYVNTVDPADPNASKYLYHGLPGHMENGVAVPDKNQWKAEMLHLYSKGTTSAADYTLWNDNLSLANNDIFKSNVDTCYIPMDMAGKYLQVKTIVLNHRWPVAYDPMQTFKSHIVKIPEVLQPLRAEIAMDYANGCSYVSSAHPAQVKLTTLTGLSSDEYVTEVWAYGNGCGQAGFDNVNLHVRTPADLGALQYPQSFFPTGADVANLSAGQKSMYLTLYTNKNRVVRTNEIVFNRELEAKGYTVHMSDVQYRRSQIPENGLLEGDYQVFRVTPRNATVGFDFLKDSSTTNRKVAYLNAKGQLVYGGSCGTATVSVKGPDKVTRSVTITVIQDFDHVEISGIKAPVLGQTLKYEASVPEDAPYRIVRVEWDGRTDDMTQWPVRKFLRYTVTVVIEPKEGSYFDFDNADYSMTLETLDGGVETVTAACKNNPDVYDLHRPQYEFSYTYPGIGEDEPAAKISELYINFPTQVPEGTSWEDWVENRLQVVSNGYDDRYTFHIWPTFAEEGDARLDSYGSSFYRYYEEDPNRTCFLKGVQTGLCLEIEIDGEEYQDVFVAEPDVYINGVKDSESLSFTSGEYTRFYVYARDTITVTDGRVPEPMPKVYRAKPIYWVTGTTGNLYVNDLTSFYACDDPRVSFRFSPPYPTNDDTTQATIDAFLNYDPEALTLTVQPVVAGNAGAKFGAAMDMIASFDQDGDGKPEYQEGYTLPIGKSNAVYYESQLPAEQSCRRIYKFCKPDGSLARTENMVYTTGVLSLPELEDCFVTGFWLGEEKLDLLSNYGLSRISSHGTNAVETYTVKTVYAGDLQINPGTTEVFAVLQDSDGEDVPYLQISVDGVHFYQRDHISGLTPKTDYVLYYRQGIDGTVYTKKFHTATTDYGVRVGRVPVTDERLGVLEADGWRYQPSNKMLFIKDLNLKDLGGPSKLDDGIFTEVACNAVIYAKGDLVLYTEGENVLERVRPREDEWLQNYTVYAEGNLTISGHGNLTVNGTNALDKAFCSENGYIRIVEGGKLTINCGTGFYALHGYIDYRYGDLEFNSYERTIGNTLWQYNSLVPHDQLANFQISPSHSTVKYEVAGLDHVFSTVSKDGLLQQLESNYNLMADKTKQSVRITATHSFTKQGTAAYLLKSGTCGGQLTYYYDCSVCYMKGTNTWTTTVSQHDFNSFAGHPATCTEGGYNSFQTCKLCGHTTFHWQDPLGHSNQRQPELQPSCTADGHPAYDVCSRCGLSSQVHIPTDQEIAQGIANPELMAWRACGHACSYVPASAPSCTQPGTSAYYRCARCSQASFDPLGLVPASDAERVAPALGHKWSAWVTTREPTATQPGEKTRSCSRCAETETTSIPATGSAEPVNPFVDVKEGKYYYKPVLWAYYHEPQITGGSDATHFSPGKTCTREQIVTFLWKACGAPTPEGSVSPFTDVKTSKYYFKPVMWAVENGITGGVGDGTIFGVGQPCTREQAMTFLWKAVGSPAPETTVSPFSDVKTGKYYFKPVLWAMENGITGGVGDGKFGVGKPCTRGQIVTFLYAAAGDQE
ncbi:MAG: S-layer homology domain-containing protein [Oscillospiraceae bacterium]|nr:S-layer homology domain-containing protein [Oscillospiraceae bacterium]